MTVGLYIPTQKPILYDTLRETIVQSLTSDSVRAATSGAGGGVEARTWDEWLRDEFPEYVVAPFAPRHLKLWEWIDALVPGERPRPKVDFWPRGGAKSSTAELGCTWAGRQSRRRFGLYVSGTQDQADKHVQSIATHFERLKIERAVNEYGASKGWTRQLLRTSQGFNVLSIGLDKGVRGVKLDELRPDFIILDDVDSRHDSPVLVEKKIATITESILPAGSHDCAVLFVQNIIHKDSVAAQLANGTAEFLLDRLPATIEPAAHDLVLEREPQEDGTVRYRAVSGRTTWDGQTLDIITQQVNTWGRRAFLREAQHVVKGDENGLWKMARDIEPFRVKQAPDLARVVVAIDPSATSEGDEAGIMVGGRTDSGHAYILADKSLQGSPRQWATVAVNAYHDYKADRLVAESNNGGDMVAVVISTVEGAPRVKLIHASRSKQTRAEPVQNLYEQGLVHHVGTFDALEDELTSWQPGDASPNRLDSCVFLVTELLLGPKVGLR